MALDPSVPRGRHRLHSAAQWTMTAAVVRGRTARPVATAMESRPLGSPTSRRTTVNRYRLDARRFAGPLCAPTRNDSETHDSDDWETVRATGRALLARGFTVWIYERVPRPGGPVTVDRRPTGAVDLHLIDQRGPTPVAGSSVEDVDGARDGR